jgi:hypothetical protein
VLTKGNVTFSNGMSVTIQGTLVSMPEAGTSGATINVPQSQGLTMILDNSGTLTGTTINVGQGSNVVLARGTYLGTTTINVAQGATADLTSGETTTYGGTLTGSGSGAVQLTSGNFTPALGGVTFNFPGGMFQWTGGAMALSYGDVTNLGTVNLSGANRKQIEFDGTLDNFGTIIQTGGGNLGLRSDNHAPTTLRIESGGQYLLESDAGINNTGSGENVILNAGIIRKTAGTGTSTILVPTQGYLGNTGTIQADSGTLFPDASTISQVSGNALTTGTWEALNGATLQFPGGTSVATNDANVTLSGTGAAVTALAGLATNNGTLTVGPGAVLNVAGNFTQTADGTLNVQVGGTPASGQFGQVAVRGAADRGGSFNVSLPGGFTPPRNAVYPVMTYASASGTFAQVTGLGSLTEQINPTGLDLVNGAGIPVALQLGQVTAPTTATTGQPIAVNWQVSNAGSTDATGSWRDSVYLSPTQTIASSSVLLGSVTHSGGLAADASYNASLTAAVPTLPAGDYYVLVRADSLDQVLVTSRADDTLAAGTGPLDISVPALTLGTPTRETFTAADQDQYYQITVPAGGSLQVSLTSAASSGALALYASEGAQPTPYNYQEAANLAGQPNQSLTVPVPGAGTYYVLVHSVAGAAATAGYTLTVTQTNALTIAMPSTPYAGGNGGNLTLDIKGTNFTPSTTASLSLGATTIDAASIFYQSASEIYVTFDLQGAATGNYTLSVQDGSEGATAPTTVSVVPATTGNPVQVALMPPSAVRVGRQGLVNVTATNTSNNDVFAPLLGLTADGATLQLPGSPYPSGSGVIFLATSPTGPAGILRPWATLMVVVPRYVPRAKTTLLPWPTLMVVPVKVPLLSRIMVKPWDWGTLIVAPEVPASGMLTRVPWIVTLIPLLNVVRLVEQAEGDQPPQHPPRRDAARRVQRRGAGQAHVLHVLPQALQVPRQHGRRQVQHQHVRPEPPPPGGNRHGRPHDRDQAQLDPHPAAPRPILDRRPRPQEGAQEQQRGVDQPHGQFQRGGQAPGPARGAGEDERPQFLVALAGQVGVVGVVRGPEQGQAHEAERAQEQAGGVIAAAAGAERAVRRFVEGDEVGVHQVGHRQHEQGGQPGRPVPVARQQQPLAQDEHGQEGQPGQRPGPARPVGLQQAELVRL